MKHIIYTLTLSAAMLGASTLVMAASDGDHGREEIFVAKAEPPAGGIVHVRAGLGIAAP